ncbi:hypothetical protein HUG15_19930 [Salicibibacter cibarius]|uniref:Uncharacterized protein n=1 Tax=Salicibibacter cibarius TaxID=2743000 RepID=A0A7T7CD56_9BACI|nr:hypothetical protein [Salicibibacter cibarius]QQK77630.1 hypothetical protein HUG15_19930 [Salicibibacter cibarius]
MIKNKKLVAKFPPISESERKKIIREQAEASSQHADYIDKHLNGVYAQPNPSATSEDYRHIIETVKKMRKDYQEEFPDKDTSLVPLREIEDYFAAKHQ